MFGGLLDFAIRCSELNHLSCQSTMNSVWFSDCCCSYLEFWINSILKQKYDCIRAQMFSRFFFTFLTWNLKQCNRVYRNEVLFKNNFEIVLRIFCACVSGAVNSGQHVVTPVRMPRYSRAASALFSLQTKVIVCRVR